MEDEVEKNVIKKNKTKSKSDKSLIKNNANKERQHFYRTINRNIEVSNVKSKVHYSFSKKEDSKINFNYWYSLKFFFYHFLYFFMLGPFSLFIIIPIEGYKLAYNMNFAGLTRGHFITIIQLLSGAPNLYLSLYFVYYYDSSAKYFKFTECIFCLSYLFVRIIIISIRYGFTNEFYINKRKTEYLSDEEKTKDLVIVIWRNITNEVMEEEIEESILRLEIDCELFNYSIISNLDEEWANRLSEYDYFKKNEVDIKNQKSENEKLQAIDEVKLKNKIVSQKTQYENKLQINDNKYKGFVKKIAKKLKVNNDETDLPTYAKKAPKELSSIEFPGRIFFKELFVFSNATDLGMVFRLFINFLTIIHFLIPFFYRGFTFSISKIFGTSFLEVYLIIINSCVGISIFYFNVLFLETTNLDFMRRLYLLRALESLLNPDKLAIESISLRYIPCLNIFLEKNYKTWMYLRLLTMDIGYKFMLKNQIYSSVLLLYYFILIILLVMGGVGAFDFPICNNELFYIIASFQVIIMLILIFRIIFSGSQINDVLNNHINELILIKNNLYFIISNMSLIKSIDSPVNMIFKRAKDFLELDEGGKNMFGLQEEEIAPVLHKTIESINIVIERTENENLFRPLKILGLKMEFSLIYQFLVGLISAGFSLVPIIFSKYNEKCGKK